MGPHGNRRAPLSVRLAGGIAELLPDPARPQGWTLLVDGVPQSYVDLADPGHLEFPYERQLGVVLRAGPARERILHLGGGALTMPRLVHHLQPRTEQVVVERDPDIVSLVSRVLPFPGSIELRIGDARTELEKAGPASYDLIIADVFVGAVTPADVASAGFARAARRALHPYGCLAMNLTDVPPLAHTRIRTATARTVFDDVVLYGDEPVLRGRRVGNVILLAGNVPMIEPDKHEWVLRGSELADFTGGARPLLDEPA